MQASSVALVCSFMLEINGCKLQRDIGLHTITLGICPSRGTQLHQRIGDSCDFAARTLL